MKYVIMDVCGLEFAVVFPEAVQHVDAVNARPGRMVSAGFCEVDREAGYGQERVRAWGESNSLGLKARPDDAQVIEFSLMNMGVLSSPAVAVHVAPAREMAEAVQ